jgi:hypothetical protein
MKHEVGLRPLQVGGSRGPRLRGIAIASAIAGLAALAGPSRAQISGFNSGTGYTANNAATFTAPDTLQLTDNFGQANTAYFDTKQSIGAFTASFTYQLVTFPANDPNHLSPADGVTFTIQNQGLNAVGDGGGDFGFAGISPGAAVFLNVYNGHTAPSTNLLTSNVNGGHPTSYISTLPVNLLDELPVDVSLAYDGTTLTETLSQGSDSFTQDYTTNLVGLIGPKAFIGFTGGSGGGASTQTVSNFVFTPETPAAPEPSPLADLAIFAMGVGGLALRARRERRASN